MAEKIHHPLLRIKLGLLIQYSDRYQILVHMDPSIWSVYIRKDEVELADWGGDPYFAVSEAVKYLDRINKKDHAGT